MVQLLLQFHLLAALLPVLALAIPSPAAPRSPATNLAGAASKDNKRYFGNAYQSFYLADPRYEPILDSQFSAYTPENEMKWEVIEPTRGVFNWTGSDLVRGRRRRPCHHIPCFTSFWTNCHRSSRTPRRPTPSSGAITSAGIPRREQAAPSRQHAPRSTQYAALTPPVPLTSRASRTPPSSPRCWRSTSTPCLVVMAMISTRSM